MYQAKDKIEIMASILLNKNYFCLRLIVHCDYVATKHTFIIQSANTFWGPIYNQISERKKSEKKPGKILAAPNYSSY